MAALMQKKMMKNVAKKDDTAARSGCVKEVEGKVKCLRVKVETIEHNTMNMRAEIEALQNRDPTTSSTRPPPRSPAGKPHPLPPLPGSRHLQARVLGPVDETRWLEPFLTNHRLSAEVCMCNQYDCKYYSDMISLQLQKDPPPMYVNGKAATCMTETSPARIKALRKYNEQLHLLQELNHKVVFEMSQRSLEIWDCSATVRLGRYERDSEAWEWDLAAAATLNIGLPMNADTMDEQHNTKNEAPNDMDQDNHAEGSTARTRIRTRPHESDQGRRCRAMPSGPAS